MKMTTRILICSSIMALWAFASCGSTSSATSGSLPIRATEDNTIEIKTAPAPAPAKPVQVTPAPAPVKKHADDEYSRAVGTVVVSKDTFEADKAEIMKIIDQLSKIMKDQDYQSWLLYVDSESKAYWSKPYNLKKAQSKLPAKGRGIKMDSLQDYFKWVFVPSRAGRTVTEIRYVSDTYVKAVQVTSPETDDSPEKYTVYYYFNKKNGHWELHLPEIED